MASIGDVWLVAFGEPFPSEPALRRPALVVGPSTVMGPNFPAVVVVPLTTTRRSQLIHVEVEPLAQTGLADVSYAQCELVRSISKQRLVHRLGIVGSSVMGAVDDAIRVFLGH